MLELVRHLKNKYKIGIVTDNKEDRINTICKYYDFYSLFDVVSISAVYKSGKTQSNIFAGTIKELNVNYDECIFIDNSSKNLIIPDKLGIKTILFDDEIRDYSLLIHQLSKYIDIKAQKWLTPRFSEGSHFC